MKKYLSLMYEWKATDRYLFLSVCILVACLFFKDIPSQTVISYSEIVKMDGVMVQQGIAV